MQEEFKILGKRVKFLRMERGISQTHMAEIIGLSQTNLSNMEAGRTAITIQNLFKIQKVIGCKMKDFFVDFDGEAEEASDKNEESVPKSSLELEDALNILKLLKRVDVKGL